MRIPCTKDCPRRTSECHGQCEDYKKYRAWCDERLRNKQLDREILGAKRAQMTKAERAKQRIMRMK